MYSQFLNLFFYTLLGLGVEMLVVVIFSEKTEIVVFGHAFFQ